MADAVNKGRGFCTPLSKVKGQLPLLLAGAAQTADEGVTSDGPFPIRGSRWLLGELV